MPVDKTYLQHRINQAADYEEQGKLLHAVQIYRALLEEAPDEMEIYQRLAVLYERLDNIQAATELLYGFLDRRPEDSDARLMAGHFLFRNHRWDEAIEVLADIEVESEPLAGFFTAYSYFMLKEYGEARKAFLEFINIETNSGFLNDAHLFLAKIYIQLKNYNEALKYARKASSHFQQSHEMSLVFAIIYYYLDMETHAVSSVETALKQVDDDIRVYEWAGKIYLKAGEYDKIEKLYYKYISNNEASSDIYQTLGLALMHNNKIKEAESYFSMALALNPKDRLAKKALDEISHN